MPVEFCGVEIAELRALSKDAGKEKSIGVHMEDTQILLRRVTLEETMAQYKKAKTKAREIELLVLT